MAPLWWRYTFRNFWCAFICRYDATNGYRFTFGLGSRYVGHSSVLIRECVGRHHVIRCYVGLDSVLNRPWIGVRSADICPIHNRSKTDKPSTIGGRIKTDTSPNAPDKTDTTPTYNRQTTNNMFERSLPDKFVCPNINWHQTDKTESIPTVNRSLPEFEDFCRFEVGFVSVWPVWLGYYQLISSYQQWQTYFHQHLQHDVRQWLYWQIVWSNGQGCIPPLDTVCQWQVLLTSTIGARKNLKLVIIARLACLLLVTCVFFW